MLELKNGDKIKFGILYCNSMGRKELLNKTIMLTPQYFEYDNGLYIENQEAPGICVLDEGFGELEPESIYHLFGNNLEKFYDCVVIKATSKELQMIEEIRKKEQEAEMYF